MVDKETVLQRAKRQNRLYFKIKLSGAHLTKQQEKKHADIFGNGARSSVTVEAAVDDNDASMIHQWLIDFLQRNRNRAKERQ